MAAEVPEMPPCRANKVFDEVRQKGGISDERLYTQRDPDRRFRDFHGTGHAVCDAVRTVDTGSARRPSHEKVQPSTNP